MVTFTDMFIWFDKLGVQDSLLPFLLIFALIFAITEQIQLFGGDKKNIRIVLAIIMGLLFVIPHITGTYPGADPVEILNRALPNVGIVIVALVMVMLVLGVFGKKLNISESPAAMIAVLFAFGFIIYVFGWGAGWWATSGWPKWLGFLADSETRALLIVVLVFFVIVYAIVGGTTKGRTGGALRTIGEAFKNMIK